MASINNNYFYERCVPGSTYCMMPGVSALGFGSCISKFASPDDWLVAFSLALYLLILVHTTLGFSMHLQVRLWVILRPCLM